MMCGNSMRIAEVSVNSFQPYPPAHSVMLARLIRPLLASIALVFASTALAQDSTVAPPKKRATRAAVPKPEPVWPVAMPDPIEGSILPAKRIVAFYGNPLSKRMGILGELPPDDMLAKLDHEVEKWTAADSTTPVQPALHLIAVVAQGSPGRDGKYRARMDSALIEKVYGWAKKKNALLFLDVQVGKSTLQQELPPLARFLERPDVHLAVDPEFSM